MATGTVKFFNEEKGFGFIAEEGTTTEYFVHSSEVQEAIKENDVVTFDIGEGKKWPMAINVQINPA